MDTMNTINNKIKDTYEGLKPSMNTYLNIQTMKDVVFILFLLVYFWY